MKQLTKPAIAVLLLTLAVLALSLLASASAVWGN
jgi:hypothetical protein